MKVGFEILGFGLVICFAAMATPAMATPETNALWLKYQEAVNFQKEKLNDKACSAYFDLSQNSELPIRDLAWIRARQTCGKNFEKTKEFDFRQYKQKPWLWPIALDIALEEFKSSSDHGVLSEIYLEKSKLSSLVSEKIDWLEKSILFAKKAKKPVQEINQLRQRLYNLAPRKKPNPRPSEWLEVATDFRRVRDFKKALKYYNKILKQAHRGLDDKYRALIGIRTTYKLMENKTKFLKSSDEVIKFCQLQKKSARPKSLREQFLKRYYEALVTGARAYWTEGRIQVAQKMLERTERELKNKINIHEVYWLRARMDEERRNYESSLSWLNKALNECKNDCVLQEKIIWNLAWTLLRIKKFSDAIARFDEAYLVTDNPFAKPKFKFWKGKALLASGLKNEAQKVFKELIAEDPIGYYGFLSYRELDQEIPQAIKHISGLAKAEALLIKDSFAITNEGQYAYWLISVGEDQAAGAYLNHVFDGLKEKKEFIDNPNRLIDFFSAYAHSKNYLSLFAKMAELPNSMRNQILALAPEIAFPQPFYEIVNPVAKKFGIKPELIYAIMRQESSFNPNARSPADAFGLMQLVPRMAMASAPTAGIKYQKESDLFRPEINIPLGANYLKNLWKKYNGQFVLVAASYNASEKAIQTWINTRYIDDPLVFIEDVPYEETQNYIKLVLRNFIYYSSLNSQGPGLKFPDWTLANLGEFRTHPPHRSLAGKKSSGD